VLAPYVNSFICKRSTLYFAAGGSSVTLPAARCPLPAARCPLPAARSHLLCHLPPAMVHLSPAARRPPPAARRLTYIGLYVPEIFPILQLNNLMIYDF